MLIHKSFLTKHFQSALTLVGGILLLSACNFSNKYELPVPDHQTEYVGRYMLHSDLVFSVQKEHGHLTLLPSFWRGAQILDSIGIDKFVSLLHPDVQFEFMRDSSGKIECLKTTGHKELTGIASRIEPQTFYAVELLLAGQTIEAVEALKNAPCEILTEERVINLGFKLLRNFPSRAKEALEFAQAFESTYPNSVELQQVIAFGHLVSKQRTNATQVFKKAYALDSQNDLSIAALRLLDPTTAPPPPEDRWEISVDLDEVFKKPTKSEIEKVKADWQARDLSAKNVALVNKQDIVLGKCQYKLAIISHQVHGSKQYGVILIPHGARVGSSPIVLELHGVDPSYSPFNLSDAELPIILKENKENAIIAIPSFRGYTLNVEDKTYVSEGSPTDAWDGAVDDAIAFLNAVIDFIPEADTSRISVFGKSRGGTAALLTGIRDQRISSVIDWAGPVDWFTSMGTFGWTLQEQVQWGLWESWSPGNGWGSASQFIEQNLKEAILPNKDSLSYIRHHILAASPLYFADDLPTAQLHYGKEDRSVPVANAMALEQALKMRSTPAEPFDLYIHESSGHDQPYPVAYDLSRKFLQKQFKQ